MGGAMSHMLRVLVVIGVGLIASGRMNAQGVVMQRNLSLEMAKTIAEAALAECKSKGYHTTVAVVDRAGQLMVMLRDEQAGLQTVEVARRKAYTPRTVPKATLQVQKPTA